MDSGLVVCESILCDGVEKSGDLISWLSSGDSAEIPRALVGPKTM